MSPEKAMEIAREIREAREARERQRAVQEHEVASG
jgi:hypothetical protein